MEKLIKKCFDKAKVQLDDRNKYLFRLLVDEIERAFQKRSKKEVEQFMYDLLSGDFELEHKYHSMNIVCDGSGEDNHNWCVKQFNYEPIESFKTLNEAISFIENASEKEEHTTLSEEK